MKLKEFSDFIRNKAEEKNISLDSEKLSKEEIFSAVENGESDSNKMSK